MKHAIIVVLAAACAVASGYLIWFITVTPNLDARFLALANVFAVFLSIIASVIISYYFARLTSNDTVDKIAEKSTEKMVHLTMRLHDLAKYLDETTSVAQEEHQIHPAAALNAYLHRTEAASRMAANLALSNETFRSDWLGVVGNAVKARIEKRFETVRKYFQEQENLERLERDPALSYQDTHALPVELQKRLTESEERFAKLRSDLPVQPSTPRPEPKTRGYTVQQVIEGSNERSQTGKLIVNVFKPVYAITASGRIDPRMVSVPRITTSLLTAPEGISADSVGLRPGTGTNYDFNVAVKSLEYGVYIPTGIYEMRYDLYCEDGREPNKSLQPTTTAVPSPATQEPRQP